MATMEARVELENGGLGNRPHSGNQLPDRLTAGLPVSVANALTNSAIGPTLGVNTTNNLFDRQAWVGLVTPVGGFLAGRQYTPAFEALATFDTMNTQSSLSTGQLGTIPPMVDIRYNSSVQYRIVKGPWNAALMYGFPSGAAGDDSRLIAVNTIYKSDSFSAGFAHNNKKKRGRSAIVEDDHPRRINEHGQLAVVRYVWAHPGTQLVIRTSAERGLDRCWRPNCDHRQRTRPTENKMLTCCTLVCDTHLTDPATT
jgi:hypothetical protein